MLPCLPGEWVSFWVSGTIDTDGGRVWAKSGIRYMLLPKVHAILGNDTRIWEQCPSLLSHRQMRWFSGQFGDYTSRKRRKRDELLSMVDVL